MEADSPPSPSSPQPSPYGKRRGMGQQPGQGEEEPGENGDERAVGMEEDEEDEDGGLPLGREDPVVREIPVYLSTELAQQLYVCGVVCPCLQTDSGDVKC